jgi:hypothetical protein
MLLDSPADAEEVVAGLIKEEGWTTDGRRHHCGSCSKLFPLIDPDPLQEPVLVLPGQIALGGS